MTIAIGMLCQDSIAIAADTQATNPDGTTHHKTKIRSEQSTTGTFVVALSSDSVFQAEMLVDGILLDLKLADPKSLDGVEQIVGDRMADWLQHKPSNEEQQYTSIVLGARVEGNAVNRDVLGMYYCEPPQIILRQTMERSKGYVAIGAGLVVTDPLFRMLFGDPVSPRVCLAQLSYLMYRAKRDCGGACGGDTDAALLRADNPAPMWIDRHWMKSAEARAIGIDRHLRRLTANIMSRYGFDDESRFADFLNAERIRHTFGSRGYEFGSSQMKQMVREPEFQALMVREVEFQALVDKHEAE
jgi:hypothetical protein